MYRDLNKNPLALVQFILLSLLFFLMAISYHPVIISRSHAVGYESGTILSNYILLLFGSLLVVSLFRIKHINKSSLIRSSLLWLIIIGFSALAVYAFYNNKDMFGIIRNLIIVICSIIIGWSLSPSKKQLTFLLCVFCFTTLFSGLLQVIQNIGGFRIEDQYLADSKNSLGSMLASSIFTLLFLQREKDGLKKAVLIGCALLSFIIIVTIRARSSLLAVFLLLFYYEYFVTRNGRVVFYFFVSILFIGLVAVAFPSIVDYFVSSISAGTQGVDITSGRWVTYKEALSFLSSNFWIGDVKNTTDIGWIHNFVLLNIYDYGLLFSWPIIAYYLVLITRSVVFSYREHLFSLFQLGFIIVLVPYVASLLEPTFPFGPGTVNVFNFVLLGIAEFSLVYSKENKGAM